MEVSVLPQALEQWALATSKPINDRLLMGSWAVSSCTSIASFRPILLKISYYKTLWDSTLEILM